MTQIKMNTFKNLKMSIFAFFVSALIGSSAYAASSTLKSAEKLEDQAQEYQLQKSALNKELDQTQSKLALTNQKLSKLQAELKAKEIQLEKMRVSVGNNPTPEQKTFIANENKRIELGAASIKSRKAAITRLERKETDISKKIARTETLISNAYDNIVALEARSHQETQAANSAKAYRMKRELEELKKENEQLKQAMAEEAERTRAANQEAERLAQAAKERESALKRIEQLAAKKETNKIPEELTDDLSQTVLPGESPIYKESDGKKVVIRSRGLSESIIMRPVGKNKYKAEVDLPSGRSYFDIKKRRYRGYFPEQDGEATYVFFYDLSNKKRPKLSVTRKEEDPSQMISNADDPF